MPGPAGRFGTALSFAVLAVVSACNASSTAPAGVPQLTVVSGAGQTASVGSTLPQPILVRLRNSDGTPVSGMPVRFQAVIDSNQVQFVVSFVARRNATTFGNVVTDTTASDGTAGALVRFGSKPGPAAVSITVSSISSVDTTRFTVTP